MNGLICVLLICMGSSLGAHAIGEDGVVGMKFF
jgi:hypothetical protein